MKNYDYLRSNLEFYSSVITLPFWIYVKPDKTNRFPILINKDETVIHPINISDLTRKDIENNMINYETYKYEDLEDSDLLTDVGFDMLYKIDSNSKGNFHHIEESVFKSLISTTIQIYPSNFRSAFIKVQMPSITIECEACNSKSLYIIPFVIRRGGFEHSKILKRNEYGNLKDYLLFIELLLMGESNPIKEFLDGLILFSNNEVIYRTKQSPFYKDTNWYNESARGLAKKIINSILERVINEKRIELNEVNETLLHKKTIGNLKLNFHEAVLRNSEGNDYGVSSQQSELEKISSGIWLFADKYYRTYDLILERNNTTSEIDILEFTILNTSITGNLSTSLAVAQKYIETVERFDISNEGWSQIANLRQSLETFDQVFNVNQTNPTLSHLYDKTMKKLGIDDLERNVKEKFKNIEYHVQSKGQLLINNNLYLLTAGLMSLGLIEILLSWIHLFLLGFRLVEFLSVILAGMGFLVFSVTIYLIFKQNKH